MIGEWEMVIINKWDVTLFYSSKWEEWVWINSHTVIPIIHMFLFSGSPNTLVLDVQLILLSVLAVQQTLGRFMFFN